MKISDYANNVKPGWKNPDPLPVTLRLEKTDRSGCGGTFLCWLAFPVKTVLGDQNVELTEGYFLLKAQTVVLFGALNVVFHSVFDTVVVLCWCFCGELHCNVV